MKITRATNESIKYACMKLPYPKNDANWTKINRTKFINNGTM